MAQRQWRSDDTDKWGYGFGDGSDGDLTISSNTTEAPIDSSCSGTSGTTSLSATNASFATGQIILIHQTQGTGAGGWELNKIAGYTAGTITTSHALTMTYTDSGASQAQVRVLKQYNNVTINSGITYTAKSWDTNVGGIIGWFAKGTTTVTGTLTAKGNNGAGQYIAATNYTAFANGIGHRGGAGRIVNSGSAQGYQGAGTGGNGGTSTAANGTGGGGAYGTIDPGAGGGHASSGGSTTGTGGGTGGSAGLTNMIFGGGGGGSARNDVNPDTIGYGGAGGGIICVFSKELEISGSVVCSGGNAGVGRDRTDGGAGAGGSVLIKAKTATLGTNKITAPAGSRGNNGGTGSVGRIHIDYSVSYTGTTSPTIDATNDLTIVEPASFMMMF